MYCTGIWYTYSWTTENSPTHKGDDMSKTAAFGLVPSPTLFSRLMATVDRLLMASARIAIRNGDLPYFGL
jgi:hypothetical protein